MLIILLSITVMFDALFVLLTQPSTLLAIVTEALQRSQRSADTLRGTARTREKRWTRWGTLYKGRPRSSRSPCTIKWRGSPQAGGRVAVSVTATTLVYVGRAVEHTTHKNKPPLFHCAAVEKIGKAAR